jgi:hypothetical protein
MNGFQSLSLFVSAALCLSMILSSPQPTTAAPPSDGDGTPVILRADADATLTNLLLDGSNFGTALVVTLVGVELT